MNKTLEFAELITKAEQGDAETQLQLGLRYMEYPASKEDYQEAYKWLTRAAEQKNAEALFQLAEKHNSFVHNDHYNGFAGE